MGDHPVTRIRNQHGPSATCGTAGCGRSVRWSVGDDEWQHLYSAAEAARRSAAAREELIAIMRGVAAELSGAAVVDRGGRTSPAFETPDQVERYLRTGAR